MCLEIERRKIGIGIARGNGIGTETEMGIGMGMGDEEGHEYAPTVMRRKESHSEVASPEMYTGSTLGEGMVLLGLLFAILVLQMFVLP